MRRTAGDRRILTTATQEIYAAIGVGGLRLAAGRRSQRRVNTKDAKDTKEFGVRDSRESMVRVIRISNPKFLLLVSFALFVTLTRDCLLFRHTFHAASCERCALQGNPFALWQSDSYAQ